MSFVFNIIFSPICFKSAEVNRLRCERKKEAQKLIKWNLGIKRNRLSKFNQRFKVRPT